MVGYGFFMPVKVTDLTPASWRIGILGATGSGVLAAVATIVQFFALARLLSGVFTDGGTPPVASEPLYLFLGATVARCAFGWCQEVLAASGAAQVGQTVRARLVSHLLTLGPTYQKRERTGEISSTCVAGVARLEGYLSDYLPRLYLSGLIPLIVGLFILYLDWPSGVVLLATGPAIPVLMVLIGKNTERHTRERWESMSSMEARFLTTLRALPTIRAFGREAEERERISRVSERLRQATMTVLRRAFFSGLALEFIATVSVALVAVMLAMRLLFGSMSFEVALLVMLLAPEFFRPLRDLGSARHAALEGRAAASRIQEILAAGPQVSEPDFPISVPATPRSIEYESVGFTYPGSERPTLREVSLRLRSGELTALIGESGAGKSTLIDLLMRFSDPSEGRLLVDGTPLSDLQPDLWRGAVGFVGQRPHLFFGTILDNIRAARPGAGQAEIEAAARLAGADEFIRRLPGGYKAEVGEFGGLLSAGQAQRVALARALLRNASILVLDEPTSALDPDNEQELAWTLKRLAEDRIVFVATHRSGLAGVAHRVLVLKDGRLTRAGSPETSPRPPDPAIRGPAGGYKEILHPRRLWSADGTPSSAPHGHSRALLRLLGFLGEEKARVFGAASLAVWTVGANVGLLAVSGYLVALSSLKPPLSALVPAVLLVQVLGGSRGFTRYGERLFSHDATFGLLSKLRGWLFLRLVPLSPTRLSNRRGGDVLSGFTNDVEEIQNLYLGAVSPVVVATLIPAATVGAFAFLSPDLALVTLVFLVLGGVGVPLVYGLLGRRSVGNALRANLTAEVVETLEGMRDLLAAGGGPERKRRLGSLSRELEKVNVRSAVVRGLGIALDNLLPGLAAASALVVTVSLVASDRIEAVYLPLILLAVITAFEAVAPLGEAARNLGASLAAGERIFTLADSEPPVPDPRSPLPEPAGRELSFNDVSFGYERGSPLALKDVSLRVGRGEKVAVVGESGSGKSTLVNLALRFWDPNGGSVRLDGEDARRYEQTAVRRAVSVASQEAHVTDGTLRENLLLARPEATPREVEEALRATRLRDLVSRLPLRLDEPLGEHGTRLSGGERRRVAVARALLKDAPFLILDEPTADLDPETEAALFREILHEDRPDRGLIVITHRLLEMESFDEIIVLARGRVEERGSHASLLAANGAYRRMHDVQGSSRLIP